MALNSTGRAWKDMLQDFEAARDEWSAMEAVVHLEFLLEARGLLMEDNSSRFRLWSRSIPRGLDKVAPIRGT